MEYSTVHYTTYLSETLAVLENPGLLLVTAGRDGQANAMTIGWATVGRVWGRPTMVVLVRPSRYTYQLLSQSDSFTVCVPRPDMREVVEYCGQYTGRDGDKLAACNLSVLPSTQVAAPGLAGCPVIYECRVVHINEVNPPALARDITAYPRGDYHRLYYGQIMAVRALPDATGLLARG